MAMDCSDSKLKTLHHIVQQLWHSILFLDKSPDDDSSNFFDLGGSSLSFTQLLRHYQFDLNLTQEPNMLDFLAEPTIAHHVRLLSMNTDDTVVLTPVQLDHASLGKTELNLQWLFSNGMSIFP